LVGSVPVAGGGGGPRVVQAADGHLLIFRGLSGRGLRVARSARPHSIDGAWTDAAIAVAPRAACPMPVRTADGAIFVFMVDAAGSLAYIRSADDGRTWRACAALTGAGEIRLGRPRHEPATPLHPERIAIVYARGGGLHYTYFTPSDLRFHAADGRTLGADDAGGLACLKVMDTSQPAGPCPPDDTGLVGSTLCGWPFVVWTRDGAEGRAAMWSPLGWRFRVLPAGLRAHDMERLDATTWRVYATDAVGGPGVATYRLTAGTDWRFESMIAMPAAVRRVELIADRRDPARFLAMGVDRDVFMAGLVDTSDVMVSC